MTDNVTYRTIRMAEVPKWLDFLCNEIFPDDPRDVIENIWHKSTQDPSGVFLALDAEENIIGSLKVDLRWQDICGYTKTVGIISGVGVHHAWRRRGIGSRLFAMCHEYLLDNDVAIAHLYSKPEQYRFFLNMDYSSLNQRPDEDFFRMYRVLKPFYLCTLTIRETGQLMAFLYFVEELRKRAEARANNSIPTDKTDP